MTASLVHVRWWSAAAILESRSTQQGTPVRFRDGPAAVTRRRRSDTSSCHCRRGDAPQRVPASGEKARSRSSLGVRRPTTRTDGTWRLRGTGHGHDADGLRPLVVRSSLWFAQAARCCAAANDRRRTEVHGPSAGKAQRWSDSLDPRCPAHAPLQPRALPGGRGTTHGARAVPGRSPGLKSRAA